MADQAASPSTAADTTTSNLTETTTATSSSSSSSPTCVHCAISPEAPKQCLKCHSVTYCSKDCQKAHFKAHKKVCAALAQEYVKANEPKMASRSSAGGKGGARERGLQKWQFDT